MFFAAIRYFLIGVLLVLNIAILVLSSSVFTVANANNIYRPIYVYLIFLSAFSCVFLIPIALIDFFRKRALPSRVLFELGWLILFWIMHLAGASSLTASPPCGANASCDATQRTLRVFAWLAVSDLLLHLAALLLITILHMNDIPDVWAMSFRDVPWFASQDKRAEGAAPDTQAAGGAQGASQDGPHQQPPSRSRPWHGRHRSQVHSWRDRFPSESFSSQDRDNQNQNPPTGDDAVDPARAFYPFLGQGPDADEARREHEETALQPLPVAFTFERTRQSSQQPPAQPAAPTRSESRRESNGRPSNAPAEQSQLRQLPQIPSEPQPQSQARPTLPSLPPPQTSRRPSRRATSREAPQLVPLNISRSQSERPQQTSSSRSRAPPADSLLFSTASPQQPTERPQRQPVRLLPNTSAFYGTAVQSIMRDQEEDGGEGEDGRSTIRRVYASTPQQKPLSEAQAYAAEAMKRTRTTAGRSNSGRR